jgi:acyl transferase domain-containing protein
MSDHPEDSLDIAVVGMNGRFPKAGDLDEFWQNLREGRCAVTSFSEEELLARGVDRDLLADPRYVRAGSLMDDIEMFDAEFFGYSPREAELMDPQHRVLLECAWAALESAGYDPGRYDGLIGVYAGASNNTYLMFNVARHTDVIEAMGGNQVMLGNSADFLTSRVSYKLGLEGPSLSVQTACSTSLVSVVLACQGLLSYQCDMALAGGVSIDVLKSHGYLYAEDGLYSPDGLCRSFDAKAQGTSGGNGVGLVVLKRLHDAITDGDHIHAVIKGTAINNDGMRRAGYTAPGVDAQALAIATALANADVEAGTVGYVEAHGSATVLGDPIEVAALTAAFKGSSGERPHCALGSVKSNIGHLDAAAGIAGLIKAILVVEKARIPPTLHFEEPNPRIDFANSPFYVNTELSPWPITGGPRRAGVSSFGLGGTNAHVVLEEAPRPPTPAAAGDEQLLLLSAKTEEALEAASDRLEAYLRDHPDVSLADVAFTLQMGRKAFNHRRVLVCENAEEARGALDVRDDGRLLSKECVSAGRRPVAFMFTGFGDQYPGMAHQLYQREPVFRTALDRCAAILRPHLDADLRTVLFGDLREPGGTAGDSFDFRKMLLHPEQAEHELNQPLYGHAAVFAVEYALVELWNSWGVVPDALIGHSLGEYVAACVAGVFSLADALMLVVARARLIHDQRGGAMLAVPLGEQAVIRFLDEEVSLAAVNSPRTCVLSGPVPAIENLARELRKQGIASRRLPTAFAFHSRLMEPVVEPYAELVRGVTLNPPRLKFVSNVTGTWITPEEATDPDYWARHVCNPVRFTDGIATLLGTPDVILLEVGPGKTLCSAALQHPVNSNVKDRVVLPSMADAFGGQSDRTVILRSLGQLWLAGVAVDWSTLHAGTARRRVALPTYPFARRKFWLEPDRLDGREAAPGRRRGDISNWFHTPSWQRLGAVRPDPAVDLAAQRWLVFADEHGVGERVVERLERLGARVVSVAMGEAWSHGGDGRFVLDPREESHYTRLAEALRAEECVPDRVVHCWSVGADAGTPSTPEHVQHLLTRGFHSLVRWTKASEPDLIAGPMRWDVISTEVHRVTGEEPLCPEKSTMGAVCKVAKQEYPFLDCAWLDVRLPRREDLGQLAGRLMLELAAPIGEAAVALRGPYRWGQVFAPAPQPGAAREPLRPHGTYLITGGLGRIGLVIARSLARSAETRLALVSRTGIPPRDTWDDLTHPPATTAAIGAVRELEAMGAQVMVCAADVSDERRMRSVLDEVTEAFGPVNGVVHAAGITGDKAHRVLAELGEEESAWHFRSKLHGLHVLDRLFTGKELDFAILCSSLSPLLGGLSLCAYAAANAFLDAYAQQPGSRWTSVNWEGWRFPADEAAERGVGVTIEDFVISPEEGSSVFERLLTFDLPSQVVVSTAALDWRVRMWADPAAAAAPVRRHARPSLSNPYVAPSTDTEGLVAETWQELLGMDKVGVNDNFFELGGSSLLGIQVIHALRRKMKLAVPLTIVYEGPTIRTLAQLLSKMEGRR